MKRRVYIDAEFLEDGRTIDLISLALIKDTGEEYYAVNAEMPLRRIQQHEWLMENVFPHLPTRLSFKTSDWPYTRALDRQDPSVKAYALIRDEVLAFLSEPKGIELWGWYSAYDHVLLAQLWGPMINLPNGIPMWTNDLRQEVERLKRLGIMSPDKSLPKLLGGVEHNALHDAREIRYRHKWLKDWCRERRVVI